MASGDAHSITPPHPLEMTLSNPPSAAGPRLVVIAQVVASTGQAIAAVVALVALPLLLVAAAACEDRAVRRGQLREPGLWRELL